jgi:hypothetical protein
MTDSLSRTWIDTVSTFLGYVHDLNESPHEDMSRGHKAELKTVEAGLHAFILSFNRDFYASCTRQNLLFLSNSWAALMHISAETTMYWRTRFPEWSYMITQLHAFVNERAIADMVAHNTPRLHSLLLDLKDTGTHGTGHTSSISKKTDTPGSSSRSSGTMPRLTRTARARLWSGELDITLSSERWTSCRSPDPSN